MSICCWSGWRRRAIRDKPRGMSPALRLGFLSCLGCYTIWGCLPLYFRVLDHIAPEEMLAHRIIWSVPTGLILIVIARNWDQLKAALTWRRIGWLSVSALLIGLNLPCCALRAGTGQSSTSLLPRPFPISCAM